MLVDTAQFMSIFKNLFSNSSSQGKTFRKACLDLQLLPSGLSDITPYKCQLGGGLLLHAVKDKHGHRFCRECVEQRIAAGVYCEVDKNDKHKLKKEDLLVDNQSDFLMLRCPNAKQDSNPCEFRFNIRDYKQYDVHRNICPKALVTCTMPGCQGMIFREDMNEHLKTRCHYVTENCPYCHLEMLRKDLKNHDVKCPQWPVKCPNQKCGNQIRRKMLKLHIQTLCPYTEIKCPKTRCTLRFLRNFLQIHKDTCEYADTICQHCGKSYQKFDKAKHQSTCPQFPMPCTHQGCEQILPRRQWDQHFKTTCPMKVISCPSQGCKLRFPQKDKTSHLSQCPHHLLYCQYCQLQVTRQQMPQHHSICPQFPIQCRNLDKCQFIVKRGLHPDHLFNDCPYTTIPCKYLPNKCPQQFLRKDVQQHQKNCQYRPEPCRLCRIVMPLITIETHIIAECPEHTIPCSQECGQMVIRRQMSEHIRVKCAETVVGCEYQEYGCNYTFRRKETEGHLEKMINHHHMLVLKLTFGLKRKVEEFQEVPKKQHNELITVKEKISQANVQLERVLEQQTKTLKEIKDVKDTVKEINGITHDNKNQTQNALRRIDGLNKIMQGQVRDIVNISKTLNTVASDVRTCKSDISSVYSRVGSVENAVNRIPRP